MTTILGLLGPSRSGKDTAADHITRVRGGVKVSLAEPLKEFAQHVFNCSNETLNGPSENRNRINSAYADIGSSAWQTARIVLEDFGPKWLRKIFPLRSDHRRLELELESWFYGLEVYAERLTPRLILQSLGTEFGRSIDKYVWVEHLSRTVLTHNRDAFIVVPDVRFENEVRFLRRHGHAVWWLTRPNNGTAAAQAAGITGHPSETEQVKLEAVMKEQCTLEVVNDSSLESFRRRLEVSLWQTKL